MLLGRVRWVVGIGRKVLTRMAYSSTWVRGKLDRLCLFKFAVDSSRWMTPLCSSERFINCWLVKRGGGQKEWPEINLAIVLGGGDLLDTIDVELVRVVEGRQEVRDEHSNVERQQGVWNQRRG